LLRYWGTIGRCPDARAIEDEAAVPVGGGRVRTTLAREATNTRVARQVVRTALLEAGQPQWTDAAELACSEVVTNAILHAHAHAHADIELTVDVVPDHLRVEIWDFSPNLPVNAIRDRSSRARCSRVGPGVNRDVPSTRSAARRFACWGVPRLDRAGPRRRG